MEFAEKIRAHLSELLEIPAHEIRDDTVLSDQSNWDSLTIVTLTAILIGDGHDSTNLKSIDNVRTFGDLVQMVAPS